MSLSLVKIHIFQAKLELFGTLVSPIFTLIILLINNPPPSYLALEKHIKSIFIDLHQFSYSSFKLSINFSYWIMSSYENFLFYIFAKLLSIVCQTHMFTWLVTFAVSLCSCLRLPHTSHYSVVFHVPGCSLLFFYLLQNKNQVFLTKSNLTKSNILNLTKVIFWAVIIWVEWTQPL